MQKLQPSGMLRIGGDELEYRMIGALPHEAPTLVFLHEGLGSVGQWGDFPERVATATNAGAFIYSRAGYGQSSPVPLPRPLTYMHDEALDVLPKLLDAIGFRRGILIGHSDGASIAAIYAGGVQDHRIRGLSLIAPHFVVEDVSIAAIAAAKQTYEGTDLERSWRAGTKMWMLPSAAGTKRGSIRNSANGIFRIRSPISACRCRSYKAKPISTEPCGRSRSQKKNAIARST